MTISPTKFVRETILKALQNSAQVTSLVPRLYPTKTPNKPIKPFGRYGSSDDTPSRPSGWIGGEVSAAYHVFVAKGGDILDPESHCADAVSAVADTIDSLPNCIVDRTQTLPDGDEPDAHHGLIFFTYSAIGEI